MGEMLILPSARCESKTSSIRGVCDCIGSRYFIFTVACERRVFSFSQQNDCRIEWCEIFTVIACSCSTSWNAFEHKFQSDCRSLYWPFTTIQPWKKHGIWIKTLLHTTFCLLYSITQYRALSPCTFSQPTTHNFTVESRSPHTHTCRRTQTHYTCNDLLLNFSVARITQWNWDNFFISFRAFRLEIRRWKVYMRIECEMTQIINTMWTNAVNNEEK